MTNKEIMEGLQRRASYHDCFTLDQDLFEAMQFHPNPFELVEPILELIANNPDTNFGDPGSLVHLCELYSGKGYEELLLASVEKKQTAHNIYMLHRCFNNPKDPRREQYKALAESFRDHEDERVRQAVADFSWEL